MSSHLSYRDELFPVDELTLDEALERWAIHYQRLFSNPDPEALRRACFSSQQAWISFHSESSRTNTPTETLAEIGEGLRNQFHSSVEIAEDLMAANHGDLSTYRDKIQQRAHFLDVLLTKGAEEVVPLLDEAMETEAAAI